MKITAVTKLKWGALFNALQEANWTMAELSRRVNINSSLLGLFLNLRRRPSQESVKRIEEVFVREGINVDLCSDWPETFKGFGRNKTPTYIRTRDVPVEWLLPAPQATPLQLVEGEVDAENIRHAVSTLSPRGQLVMNLRYGLNGEQEHTLDEIASRLGVTRERIRQMEAKALRIFRHPKYSKRLRGLDYSQPKEKDDG